MTARKLLLLDATNLGHTLFHGKDPAPLHERFGFALNRWRRVCEPDLAIAVFDGPGDGWRHELWPAYKAKRDDDPSKRPSATDWQDLHVECRAARLRWVAVDGVEADDLIGSYTAAAVAEGIAVDIVSSDKDLWQLVRDVPSVRVISPGKGEIADAAKVCERWGVWPNQLADLLALAGDASDNYPGVAGVGAGIGARLLREHVSLEQLLANVALVPGKLSAKLSSQVEAARLFRRLSGLVVDLPLPVALDDAAWTRSAWA
jgi:DNA polymerase-1